MVTIREIAERAGVSTATVSNVLHGKSRRVSAETLERVQQLIDEMGYVRETGMRVSSGNGPKLVATVIHFHQWFENSVLADPFYGVVTGSIEQALRTSGCYMMLYASDDMDDIFKMLMVWDVDGVIAVSFSIEDCKKLHGMARKPMISIDAYGTQGEKYAVPDVGLDDERGGFLMAQYLLEQGYDTILMAGAEQFGIDRRRWNGAQQICELPGFREGQKRLDFIELGVKRQERENRYRDVVRRLPFRRRTAFFFTSDSLAMEATRCWTELGVRIPLELGVAGFDDSINAVNFSIPRLTTVHQDIALKGRVAAAELVSAMRDPNYVPQSHKLPVSLVIRNSV